MKHLDDREFAALCSGAAHAGAAAHAASCDVCAAEVARLKGFAAEFRNVLAAASESAPLSQARAVAGPKLAWVPLAAAFAALLIVSVALLHQSPAQRPRPVANYAGKDVSDDLLLLEVDSDISRVAPEALAPAWLILQARNKEAEVHTVKETR